MNFLTQKPLLWFLTAKKKSAAKLVNRLENVIVEDEEKNTESNVDDKNESIGRILIHQCLKFCVKHKFC